MRDNSDFRTDSEYYRDMIIAQIEFLQKSQQLNPIDAHLSIEEALEKLESQKKYFEEKIKNEQQGK